MHAIGEEGVRREGGREGEIEREIILAKRKCTEEEEIERETKNWEVGCRKRVSQ